MAEERICIYKETRPQENVYEHYEFDKRHLTRQEAIEKMAKAICLCDDDGGCKGECETICESWMYYLEHAEAALNALLEK